MSTTASGVAGDAQAAMAGGAAQAGGAPLKGPQNINDLPYGEQLARNRFIAKLAEMQNTAAFGLNPQEVIRAKSGGKKDYTRMIQLSIRREFFTLGQYMVGVYWGITLGMFIGAVTLSETTPGGSWLDGYKVNFMMSLGVYLLSTGLALATSSVEAHSAIRRCSTKPEDQFKQEGAPDDTPGHPDGVEAGFSGSECITDFDCTRRAAIKKGVCKLPERSGTGKFLTSGGVVIFLVAGIVMTIIGATGSAKALPKNFMALSAIYGIFTGNAIAIIWGH